MRKILTHVVTRFACAILSGLTLSAQAAGSDEVRFDIVRFDVIGNSTLTQEHITRLLEPFTGKNRDFSDVQRALETLESSYHQSGYKMVSVEIPEQELQSGVVHFRVVPTRIAKVNISGNSEFSQANIRRSLPRLKEGETPNINDISANLRLANENPAKKITLQMETSEIGQGVDASLTVLEKKPWSLGANLNNAGTTQTGKTSLGFSAQHANVFGLDHVMSAQYSTTAEKPSQVSVYGLGYHIPVYRLGDSIDLFASYSDVDSGSVIAGLINLQVSGKGRTTGVRYNQTRQRTEQYASKLIYGFDQKAYITGVQFSGFELGKNVTVRPITLAYSGTWTLPAGTFDFSVTALRNLAGGKDGKATDFQAVRIGASANYNLLRYSVAYGGALPKDSQLRIALTGQYASDALVPGEQFGAGGASSVRGFSEREVANDYGAQITSEIYSQNLCTGRDGFANQCRILAFYDGAYVRRNKALPGEMTNSTIGSVGLGVRLMAFKHATMQADFGRAINAGGLEGGKKSRLHLSLNLSY